MILHFHPLQTDICAKFHVKTLYGWGARGGNKKKKKKKKKKDHEQKQLPCTLV
jgi:hypothetical protein